MDRQNIKQNLLDIPFYILGNIDISKIVENNSSPKHYQLIGVVSRNIKENKYFSFCKSPVDQKWYLYNDENVEQIQIDNCLNNHNSSRNEYIPCILLYKSLD